MNIAYGIIAHRNTKILETTIEILNNDNDIYLHIDEKSNIDDFKQYEKLVKFIERRIDIKWGSYSQIKCMLEILKNTVGKGYEYICILSGDDLPMKCSEDIKAFLCENKGKEFIGVQKEFDQDELSKRLMYEYSNCYFKKDKNILDKIKMKMVCKMKLLKKNKYYKELPKLYKGSNWFCISNELAEYILSYLQHNQWYEKAFENSLCGDEVFFQTIVMNSSYKQKIYKYDVEDDDNLMSLRYIDWKSGPEFPKILDETDFKSMKSEKNRDCIFARKFNSKIDIRAYRKEFNL